jgi:ribosome maturation factor RimP
MYLPLPRQKTNRRGADAPLFIAQQLVITDTHIRKLIAEKIIGTGYYILSLEIKPGNNIVVELENSGPVSIADCVDISRQIEHNLDRETEDFALQVSSPGLDKPLRDYRQYIKNIGRDLKVTLTTGEELEGRINAADEETVQLIVVTKERVPGKKKRELKEETIQLSYSQIRQAKIKINFK